MTTRPRSGDSFTWGLALLALVIAGASAWPTLRTIGRSDTAIASTYFSKLAAGGHRVGSSRAEVQIVEFGEYLCGHCVVLHGHLKALLRAYPDNVALVYQPVASGDPRSPSFLLANGAKCAAEQDAFVAYHNAAYEARRAVINRDEVARLASIAGVPDSMAHEACMDDQRYAGELAQVRQLADELDLPGTPALRIGKDWVVGVVSESRLSQVVAQVLAETR